jgi:Mg2+ and Co2+ transporter CorA
LKEQTNLDELYRELLQLLRNNLIRSIIDEYIDRNKTNVALELLRNVVDNGNSMIELNETDRVDDDIDDVEEEVQTEQDDDDDEIDWGSDDDDDDNDDDNNDNNNCDNEKERRREASVLSVQRARQQLCQALSELLGYCKVKQFTTNNNNENNDDDNNTTTTTIEWRERCAALERAINALQSGGVAHALRLARSTRYRQRVADDITAPLRKARRLSESLRLAADRAQMARASLVARRLALQNTQQLIAPRQQQLESVLNDVFVGICRVSIQLQ